MKQALCIGVNYTTAPHNSLKGCCNDAVNMAEFFRSLGYKCTVCTDEPGGAIEKFSAGTLLQNNNYVSWIYQTTRRALLRALRQLRDDSFSNDLDSAVITYSGHGIYVKDTDGDEVDGKDEAIVPSDADVSGLITDDELCDIIRSFNPRTRVFMISDSCHSGTLLDLPFLYEGATAAQRGSLAPHAWGPRVVFLSGCQDPQVSMDARNVEGTSTATGAMTACFLKVMKEIGIEAGALQTLQAVRAKLRANGFAQLPQISSSRTFAADEPFKF